MADQYDSNMRSHSVPQQALLTFSASSVDPKSPSSSWRSAPATDRAQPFLLSNVYNAAAFRVWILAGIAKAREDTKVDSPSETARLSRRIFEFLDASTEGSRIGKFESKESALALLGEIDAWENGDKGTIAKPASKAKQKQRDRAKNKKEKVEREKAEKKKRRLQGLRSETEKEDAEREAREDDRQIADGETARYELDQDIELNLDDDQLP